VSLSSLAALCLEAAGQQLLLPLDATRETLRLPQAALVRTPAGESITHAGRAIPLLRLERDLGGGTFGPPSDRPCSAVVVASGDELAAVVVDRLRGVSQVVVRPLPPLAAADPLVMGAALGSDGDAMLVLDPGRLVKLARGAPAPERAAVRRERPPVLVIDDSLTTRMLEQSILESAGYEVDVAASAEEGLQKARARDYGLFLVDVEMPGMDGFTFVETTRHDPSLGKVPAILVTSRSSAEDRRRGQQAGARAYVVKSEFDQVALLQTIGNLVANPVGDPA
jgi:two-component system chemotaxis sensor kinase CheA